jgi:hypothetical protein
MIYKTNDTIQSDSKIINDPVSNIHLLTDEEEPDLEKLGPIYQF